MYKGVRFAKEQLQVARLCFQDFMQSSDVDHTLLHTYLPACLCVVDSVSEDEELDFL